MLVIEIPATITKENPTHLRVAAYCCVSTEHEALLFGQKTQEAYFTSVGVPLR